MSRPEDDNSPMLYTTIRDNTASAHELRNRLIAEGASPDSVIFISELTTKHIPPLPNESPIDYPKRYMETLHDMKRRGVKTIADQCIMSVASEFATPDGRVFNLGPGSGVTKGEFREFGEWFSKVCEEGRVGDEVPERWAKFEKKEVREVGVEGTERWIGCFAGPSRG